MIAAATYLLAGCSSGLNPVNWWHQQQGGKIAEQRPAPPGADQPYPNLATVPAKPAMPDQEALKQLTASLVADRTNAQHAAQAAPLPDPSSPSASPGLFGIGSAPPPPPAGSQGQVASASLPAVNAPPAPASPPPAQVSPPASASRPAPASSATPPPATATAAPPAAAPRKPVQSAPIASAPAPAPAAQPSPNVAAAAPPALPEAPPPRPAAAGAPPPPAASPDAPMPAAGRKGAEVVFLPESASLSAAAADEVKAFAAQRGNAVIGVTGYGDATASDPAAQSAALNLGLSRAQAIVDTLKAAGVPANAIRVSAEASGRGASLHLLQ